MTRPFTNEGAEREGAEPRDEGEDDGAAEEPQGRQAAAGQPAGRQHRGAAGVGRLRQDHARQGAPRPEDTRRLG